MLQVTLALFIEDSKLLLGVKGKKIGKGLLNGPGGKIDPGETAELAMIRESYEEIGATPTESAHVATITFTSPGQPQWNMVCYAYIVHKWVGIPTETDELLALQWFPLDNLPWDRMWKDDAIWLPKVLDGNFVQGSFELENDGTIIRHELTLTESPTS